MSESIYDSTYIAAVEAARAEYDVLFPDHEKLTQRLSQLRAVINAGSALVGQPVEEKYTYGFLKAQRTVPVKVHR